MEVILGSRICRRAAIGLLTLGCFGGTILPAAAQVQTNTEISGTVSDAQGAVVPGASVSLRNQDTGEVQKTITNGAGSYAFLSILPGTYTVTAAHAGFKTAEVTNRVAQVAEPAQVDLKLEVGQVSQTVTVSAAGAELIDTTTAEVSGTMNQQLVSNLPLNGGDFLDLVTMVPGTTSTTALGPWTNNGSNQASFTEASLMAVSAAGLSVAGGVYLGGSPDTSSNISIDGSNVQLAQQGQTIQLQSRSDIQEVKVESGVMNAEFGFGTGAVNTVTKSGTKKLHGEAFEYLRNNDLDANNFFSNLAGLKNPGYKMNQFGASVGGPILRNKLHFFANYEGLRVAQSTVNEAPTPPAAVRNGNFSSLGQTVYNPYQYDPASGLRTPFPNDTIPTGPTSLCSPNPTCMDPAMVAYLKYSPLPTTVIDGIPEYVNETPTTITRNQYTGRIDWDHGEKTHVFGRYTYFNDYSFATGVAPIAGTANPFGSINPTVSWVQIFSPTAVNNLTLSYTRGHWANSRATNGIGNISSQLGLQNTSNNPGGPAINATNYTITGSSPSLANDLEDNLQFKDDFSLAKGRHTFKFGVQANNRRVHYNLQSFDKGQLIFEDIYTAACPLGNKACTAAMTAAHESAGGEGFADYLLGAVEESKLTIPGAVYDVNETYYGGYAQDSWRPFPRLTLNLGLRYDYWTPWLNVRGMAARWDAATGNVVYALQNPLDYLNPTLGFGRTAPLSKGENRAGYRTGNKDFAPRVGVAYLLTPNTTLRAGAGIYFDGNANLNQFSSEQSGVGPFGVALDNKVGGNEQLPPILAYQQFPTPPLTAVAVPSATAPVSIRVLPSDYFPTPTVYQWTVSVQHRLGKDWVVESTYLGTHTIREPQYVDMNIPNQPLGVLATLSIQQRRLFPDWGGVTAWSNVGFARYNALITSLKTPQWNGLTLMSWFSYSRDAASFHLGNSSYGNLDFRHPGIWAGPSLLNPDLRNVNTWTYELPIGKGRKFQPAGPLEWVAGEWQFSGNAEFSQGGHNAVYLSSDNTGQGQPYAMPNQTCDPNHVPGGRTRLEWFNNSCFAVPAFGVYGNAHFGSFIEPGVENWNLALQKSFAIPKLETNQLQFRTDFFNAWNHTQWGYVSNVMSTVTSSRVEAAHTARQIQFSLKYLF
jgi:outer membrane receptor protein involved in Fe transport